MYCFITDTFLYCRFSRVSWVIEEIPTLKSKLWGLLYTMSYNSAHIGEPDRGHAHFYSYYILSILYVYILNENFKPCVIKPVFFSSCFSILSVLTSIFVGKASKICMATGLYIGPIQSLADK